MYLILNIGKKHLFICTDDEIIHTSILWLQNNLSPWELVENHWKITSKYRINAIENNLNKNVDDILSEWPILKHPTAHKLIYEDFKTLKLTKSEDSIKDWFTFFSNIEKICSIKEDQVTNELQVLLQTDDLQTGKFKR